MRRLVVDEFEYPIPCGGSLGVLDVGGAVGQLGANPVSLESANGKVTRQADIDTAAYLESERVVGQRPSRCGKEAVETVG